MNRIAAVTVIRGAGACEVYMNGIVQEEIEKMKERHNKEMRAKEAELEATKNRLNDTLSDRLGVIRAGNAKRVSTLARIREKIEILWCQFWGMGYEFGWWTCDDDEA